MTDHGFEHRYDYWGAPDLYYQGKLVINHAMWKIFEEAGFDMSQYVLSIPLPPGSICVEDL